MRFDYYKTARNADKAFRRFGQPMALMKLGAGTYDPATGSVARAGSTHAGWGVTLAYKQNEIDGTVIQQGDLRVLLTAVGMPCPDPGDTISFAAHSYSVAACSPLAPAGVNVLFDITARGA